MEMKLIITFIVLMILACAVITFILRWVMFSSTESSVLRLDEEIAKAGKKQLELNRKIKQADADLARRQAEVRAQTEKMRIEAEEGTKDQREELISKARLESEEIIAKAQKAKKELKMELEKEMDVKALVLGTEVLNELLSQHAKSSFQEVLVSEYLEKVDTVDMSRINTSINEVDLITVEPVDETTKNRVQTVLKHKLNRDVSIKNSTDPNIGGGVILKFDGMALDGSLKNSIRELAVKKKKEIESQKVEK